MTDLNDEEIAIVGAGSIGVAWAAVFVAAQKTVRLFDPDTQRLVDAKRECLEIIEALRARGLAKTPDRAPEDLITTHHNLKDAVKNVTYVQECAPEKLSLKQKLFAEIAEYAPLNAILASSSSATPISAVVSAFDFRDRCLVVHPLNPPYLLRVVEIVPAEFTDEAITKQAADVMHSAGMEPLQLGSEIEGFLFNRLQGALLREAYCLVRDDIASVEEVDKAIRDGLGVRWSVLGVFETVDLNTRGGIASHAKKLGPAYARMGAERGQNDPWTDPLVSKVAAQRREELPLDKWEEMVAWRDARLMDVAELRQNDAWRRAKAVKT